MSEWWNTSTTETIKKEPWLHPAINLYLNSLIEKNWKIFEQGSGGSTFWFAERCAKVVSLEHDIIWFDALKDKMPPNVDYFCCRAKVIGSNYDLMLIDGRPHKDRGWLLDHAEEIVKPGGIVVLDNANRPEFRVEREKLKKRASHFITFLVNPPGHSFIETDMYRTVGGDARWI